MQIVIQNFLTFPKYQKQKFWKNLNSNLFTPPPSEGGTKKKIKMVLEPKLLDIIVKHIKIRKNPKDELRISKIEQDMGIFASQPKAKSHFLQIFKSRSLTQFLRSQPKICHAIQILIESKF